MSRRHRRLSGLWGSGDIRRPTRRRSDADEVRRRRSADRPGKDGGISRKTDGLGYTGCAERQWWHVLCLLYDLAYVGANICR